MTQTELVHLRKRLPYGYAKKLAKITGLSNRAIYSILHGYRNNEKVLKIASDLADEYAAKTKQRMLETVSAL